MLKFAKRLEKQSEYGDSFRHFKKLTRTGCINFEAHCCERVFHALDMLGLERRKKKSNLVRVFHLLFVEQLTYEAGDLLGDVFRCARGAGDDGRTALLPVWDNVLVHDPVCTLRFLPPVA